MVSTSEPEAGRDDASPPDDHPGGGRTDRSTGRLDDLIANFDPNAVVRGRQFEAVCRWFLLHSPVYQPLLRRVWFWRDWPGRWGADAGIDLVAEAHDGGLWAIQAKAYDPAHAITKADVDTFLSESARPRFAFRLLIATTNRIGTTARRTLDQQEKPAHLLMRADLERAAVVWPASPNDLRAVPVAPRIPLPHQREAVHAVLAGFQQADRGQLLMACGTGKTLTALWVAEGLQSQRTLVLVPSLSLLAQTLREWTANASAPFAFLAVCSDETVVDHDQVVASTSELGVPVTTEPAAITAFVRGSGPRVVFATYQSSPRLALAVARGVPTFDVAIADEAHRCAGPAAGAFGTILNGEAILAERRLFMTATPRYFTDWVRREAADVEFDVASMDDPERFGPVFHRLSFAEAIARDLLADYRVAVVGVDDATYRSYAERGRFVTIDGVTVTDARTLAGAIGLAKAMRGYDLRRVISFHNRVVRARDFAASLPGVIAWMPADERPAGAPWTRLISGEMTSGDRDALLGRFRNLEDGERGLLSNARCLAEGVDVPAIDGVAFLDPRRSQVDVVQAVGRAIRRSPDKTHGTIVVPVFVDTDADPEAALDASAFRPVWEVLKALRAHDELLAEELDALRRDLGRRGRGEIRLPAKIAVDLPEAVGEAFARAFRVRLVEQTTSSWEASFGALEAYVGREGHTEVPKGHVEQGIPIWRWMGKQRARHKRGDLTAERVVRLEALPGWQWEPYEEQWEKAVACLEQFTAREGHASVPAKHVEDGFRLGQWVNAVRTQQTRGELLSERVRRLEAVPGWTWNARAANWDEGFRHLIRYAEREQNVQVPQGHVEDGFNLGNWIGNQRAFYKGGKLSASRIERLEALSGWSWDTLDEAWEQGFAHLQRYAAREHHAEVPQPHVEDGFSLGRWVARQRQQRAKMDPERAQRLEQVPGWAWNTLEAAWDRAFGQLQAFAEREGHGRVRDDYGVGNLRLGAWVGKQRDAWRNGRLSPDRVARLESVPGWEWDPDGAAWERFFRRLLAFAGRHGHTTVPQQFVDGDVHLGRWSANQRTAFTVGRLDQDRIDRLAALPGWTWTPREAAWEEGLTRLRRFVEREGHANVVGSYAEEGFKLGTWVQRQRQAYRTGGLVLDRVRRLEEVPGWEWEVTADPWEDGFARLGAFVERERHARVPADHEEEGFDLGGWVSRQRQAKRSGQLADERERRLEALSGWSWQPKADRWEEGYAVLQAFAAREHHALVERDHVEAGFKLGAWVVEQRQAYRQARIRPERAERLAALPGWVWSRRDDWWERGYEHLLRYAEREGHAQVPIDHEQDGFKLGRWVVNQRVRARGMPDRARRLEGILGWTWSGKGVEQREV